MVLVLTLFMMHCVELQQLTGHHDLDLGHQFERLKPADDDDNARNVKLDELEKRNKLKRESEMAMRREWFEEVYALIGSSVKVWFCSNQ